MRKLDIHFSTPDEAREFVLRTEAEFEEKLRLSVRDALSIGNKIITLAGPTCSGKTTTANLLDEEIEKTGHQSVVFSIDDFYLDNIRARTPEGEVPDFDSVKTIDLKYLEKFTKKVLSGKTAKIPKFNFTNGRREGYTKFVPLENDIYVFEGIQAMYPEVSAILGECTKIFIAVGEDVCLNGVEFEASDIRLLRRTIRDYKFRNSTPEYTLFCWDKVRENEVLNIFPNAGKRDIFINSYLPYELFALSETAYPLLSSVAPDDAHYERAKALSDKLLKIKDDFFDLSFIPDTSMFREFIGPRE